MACMSPNTEIRRRDYGYSSQPTNWISDSVMTCHITPEITYFLPGPLVETDKYIRVVDGNFSQRKILEKF